MASAKALIRVASLVVLVGALSACQNGGSTLGGDLTESSKCPPNGCAGLAADLNQISVTGPGKTTIYAQAAAGAADTIELGGNCYASTYANNRLEVSAFVYGSAMALASTDVVGVNSASTVPKCVAGRYSIALNGAKFPTGANYKVRVQMVAIDDKGMEWRNSSTGLFDVTISR